MSSAHTAHAARDLDGRRSHSTTAIGTATTTMDSPPNPRAHQTG